MLDNLPTQFTSLNTKIDDIPTQLNSLSVKIDNIDFKDLRDILDNQDISYFYINDTWRIYTPHDKTTLIFEYFHEDRWVPTFPRITT